MGSRSVSSNTFNGPTQINQGDVFNRIYSSELLPAARSAAFDSHAEEHNAHCLPDTRTDLLRQIQEWADMPRAECIYWLNGMAGTGKSTIARTIARWFKAQGWLGASFFFKRGERDRGHAGLFFTTIASQLVSREQALEPQVREALRADPALPGKALGEQYEKLVLQPLAKVHDHLKSKAKVIIVIDALDECDRDDDIKLIIHLLAKTRLLGSDQIRIFVTSRPELPIRLGFEKIEGKYEEVALHTIPERVIEHDISVFFKHELERIRGDYNSLVDEVRKLPARWPGESIIQDLVQRAVPLFIYAATVCRFIQDQRCTRPAKQLAKVLEYPIGMLGSRLDGAYRPVLDQLLMDLEDSQKQGVVENFRHVVGSAIVLSNPLSTGSLAALLGIDQTDVEDTLLPLHSVLSIPSSSGSESPVRLLHLSFRDFLIDPNKKSTNPFWVDEIQHQSLVGDRCLQLLGSHLKKDICNLKAPAILRSDVDAAILNAFLPAHVQYACLFWVHHLEQGKGRVEDGEQVHDFLRDHFLHWLEALSFMGRISESIVAINALLALAQYGKSVQVTNFLRDANRFVLNCQPIIDASPLQLYSSALVFSPEHSIIRNTFRREVSDWFSYLPEVDLDWSACLQTLEGHTDTVRSVVFSYDDRYIASASEDRTVKVWDTLTGKCLQTLSGHIYHVTSAVFSPDGKRIVSSSIDKTIKIWDAITGKCLQTLENVGGGVNSIAFSHDGKHLASGSFDKSVKIWDAATGQLLLVARGHSRSVHSVAFSHDDKHVVSASDDKTIKIWDVATGECLETLEKHSASVTSVAFSADSRYLVSASSDMIARIWDVATSVCVHSLRAHLGNINWVAFSPDSHHVASASSDNMVKIWDANSGKFLLNLEGHTDYVTSVAYSNHGVHIASASSDKTIKIWNRAFESDPHSSRISTKRAIISIDFSHDNKYFTSVSQDWAIKLWDAVTGTCLRTLKGYERRFNGISLVAFSYDNKRLALGSGDGLIRTWDAATGKCLLTSARQPNSVLSVAFSRNGKRLVSAIAYVHAVRIFDSFTGTLLAEVNSYTREHNGVCFSPDGKSVISTSQFHAVNIWDWAHGQCLQTLEGHSDRMTAVSFSETGRHLFTASEDQTVRIWDTTTGTCLQTYNIGRIINKISSDSTLSCLRTEVGAFDLNVSSEPGVAPTVPGHPKPRPIGHGLSLDGIWVTWNGANLLWLPPRYRLSTSVSRRWYVPMAIGGTTAAISFESGQPLIINFSAGGTPVV